MNYRFWFSDTYGLIRQHSAPGSLSFPELWRDGQWRQGTPHVMDAITGMGEDAWSSGGDAEPWDEARAAAYAKAQGIDLLGH